MQFHYYVSMLSLLIMDNMHQNIFLIYWLILSIPLFLLECYSWIFMTILSITRKNVIIYILANNKDLSTNTNSFKWIVSDFIYVSRSYLHTYMNCLHVKDLLRWRIYCLMYKNVLIDIDESNLEVYLFQTLLVIIQIVFTQYKSNQRRKVSNNYRK